MPTIWVISLLNAHNAHISQLIEINVLQSDFIVDVYELLLAFRSISRAIELSRKLWFWALFFSNYITRIMFGQEIFTLIPITQFQLIPRFPPTNFSQNRINFTFELFFACGNFSLHTKIIGFVSFVVVVDCVLKIGSMQHKMIVYMYVLASGFLIDFTFGHLNGILS